MRIEVLLDVKTTLGEGPLWDVDQQRLYFIDSFDGRVFRTTADGRELRAWDVPEKIGSMALRKDGLGAIVSLQSGFHLLDFKTGEVAHLHDPEPGYASNRINDGKVDKQGRFVAGSMDTMEEGPNGALYSVATDFTVTTLDRDIVCSNGPCWSPDGRTFYFADTFQEEIWAYDYDLVTGTPTNRRLFASTAKDDGVADGSTVDAEGYLWNAQLISGDLIRYAPDGSVERKITMPVKNITSVNFGGPDLDEIYVTSMARVKHPAVHDLFATEAKPQFGAGHLFRIKGLGIKGVPEPRFAG